MSAAKKRKRSSLALCKVKYTDSPSIANTAKKRKRSSLALCKVKYTDSPSIANRKDNEGGGEKKHLLPNPDNVEMDEAIRILKGRIDRLKVEEQDWNNYMKQLDDKIDEWEAFSNGIEEKNPETDRLIEQSLLSVNEQSVQEIMTEYNYVIDLKQMSREVKNARDEAYILTAVHEQNIHRLEIKSLQISEQYQGLFEAYKRERDRRSSSPRRAFETIMNLPLTPPDSNTETNRTL